MGDSHALKDSAIRCQRAFRQCLFVPLLNDQSWVENRLGDFNLWLTNLRVLKPGHASLDYRLRDREDLRNVIAGLLQSLHGFIEACRVPYEPSDSDHEVQGSDGSASAWSDVSDSDKGSEKRPVSSIFSDPTSGVESTLDRLIRLGMVIRKSGNKFRHELADRALDVSYYQDFKRHLELVLLNDANRHHLIHITGRAAEQKILTRATALVIKRRLLDPGQLTEFQQRAIHANIIRRNRFDFAKKRELKANPRDSEPMLTKQQPINAEHKATNLVPQTVVSRSQFKKYETKSQVTISHPSMVETATRVGTITTPVEPTPSKAATRITNMSSTGQNLDYPPCPQLKDLNDASFQCPFCCRQLPRKYLEKSGWRSHVHGDIMPYICIFQDCANKNEFYESKEEWMQHLRATHSEKYWQCPFPNICKNTPESRFTTESDWIHHMATHQTAGNQTRFSPTQLQIVAGTNTIHDCSIDRCPLCGFSSPANKGATIKHIAEHLHSFALRSLSWESYVDEDQSAATQAVDDKYTPSKTSDDSREVFESEDQTATASDDLDTYLDQFAGVITHWKSLVLNSNIPSYYKDIFKQVSRMADSLHASAKMRIEPIDSDAIRGMETGLLDICWIFKQLEEAAHSVFHDETMAKRLRELYIELDGSIAALDEHTTFSSWGVQINSNHDTTNLSTPGKHGVTENGAYIMTETSLTVESYSTDIWKLAFGRLEPKEQQSLIPKHMTNRTSDNLPESSTNISPNLNEINQLAKEIYNEEDKKERIITRECARNICSSVAACKDIPRLFSPVYRDSDRFAGLGWQALYLGLDIAKQDSRMRDSLLDCLEFLAHVLERCAIFEKKIMENYGFYASKKDHILDALLKSCELILQYTAELRSYLSGSSIKRTFRDITGTGKKRRAEIQSTVNLCIEALELHLQHEVFQSQQMANDIEIPRSI